MAAGAGSRYGGPKQLAPLGPSGERLFDYSVFDAVRSGFRHIVFVVREELAAEFQSIADGLAAHIPFDPHVVVQRLEDLPDGFRPGRRDKPWGTAHAVLAARSAIDGPFAVVNADDFYGAGAYRLAADAAHLAAAGGITTVVAMRLADTLSAHGPVTRAICAMNGSRVTGLDEVHDIARDGANLAGVHSGRRRLFTGDELVSMNFWVCPPALLPQLQSAFASFLIDHVEDADAEFRLPEAIGELARRGEVELRAVHAPGPWFGLTHAGDRPAVVEALRRLSEDGIYPVPLWNR
jgi:NDP-sugar pyrophosphorylase family protein